MTAFLPLAETVGHRVFTSGTPDAHGNVTKGWAEPVDVDVYGWHTGQSEEPQIEGHERLRVDGQVLAPESWRPGSMDKVVLPGVEGEFSIVGVPEDYNHGPFGFTPGVVVNLQRIDG